MSRIRPYFLISALGFLLLLPGNNVIPMIDRDESRFSQATVEMIERHEWVIPYFNHDYRFDKPVLTYWLMRGSYALFGIGEFGARFHSAVAAVGVGLLILAMGRRWFSPQAGLVSAIGWLTCAQVQFHGRAAVADMPMVFCVTLAMWLLGELRDHPLRISGARFWIFYAALGVGFLAKGPIALAAPLVGALLWRWVFWRRPMPWSQLNLLPGLLLALAIMGAWGIPALIRTHGLFWKTGIGEHVVERGVRSFNARMFLPIYYPFSSLFSLFPWSFFVVAAWRRAREADERARFLAAWFIAPFLIFSFYATQLPHYIMPGFPAFFLLIGPAWERMRRRRAWLAVGVLVIAIAIQAAGFWLRAHLPAVHLKDQLRAMPPNAEFGFYRYREPSLVFYSDRRWETLHNMDEVQAFAARPGPRVLVMQERDKKGSYADEIAAVPTNGFSVEALDGWNSARSQWITLKVFARP